jgi:polysaccharide pyruvyl transferase CsaB
MGERMILLAGGAGHGNVGDDAIALATAALLQEEAPDLSVVVAGGDPALVRGSIGLPAERLTWRSPYAAARLLALIRRSSAVLIGGGGLLQDLLPHFYRPYLLLALAAKGLRRPVVFHAVGAYPPRTGAFSVLLRAALLRADAVTVRDEFSRRSLAAAGVNRPVVVTADPAITLRQPAGVAGSRIDQPPLIAVSLRPWYHLGDVTPGGDTGELTETLARCLDAVVDATGCRLLFIPLHFGGPDDDRQIQKEVLSRMRCAEAAQLAAYPGPLDALAAISRCGLLIGMRLHANILAAASGVPSIALAYDPKVSEFMHRLGCADRVLGLRDLCPAEIARRAMALLDRREEAVAGLLEPVRAMTESVRGSIRAAIQLAGQVPAPGVQRAKAA